MKKIKLNDDGLNCIARIKELHEQLASLEKIFNSVECLYDRETCIEMAQSGESIKEYKAIQTLTTFLNEEIENQLEQIQLIGFHTKKKIDCRKATIARENDIRVGRMFLCNSMPIFFIGIDDYECNSSFYYDELSDWTVNIISTE